MVSENKISETVELSYYTQWVTPDRHASELKVKTGAGFEYRYRPGVKTFELDLLSTCCGKAFAQSYYRPQQGPFYCPDCYTLSIYDLHPITFDGHVKKSTAWFAGALEHHYDPFTSVLLAHDLHLFSRKVFKRWCDLQGYGDRHFLRQLNEPVETTLRTLVEEFSGELGSS